MVKTNLGVYYERLL